MVCVLRKYTFTQCTRNERSKKDRKRGEKKKKKRKAPRPRPTLHMTKGSSFLSKRSSKHTQPANSRGRVVVPAYSSRRHRAATRSHLQGRRTAQWAPHVMLPTAVDFSPVVLARGDSAAEEEEAHDDDDNDKTTGCSRGGGE